MLPTNDESSLNFFIKNTGNKGVWNLPYTFFFTLIIVFIWTGAQMLGKYLAIKYNPEYVQYLPDFLSKNFEAIAFLDYKGDIVWPASLISAVVGILAIVIFVRLKKEKKIVDYLGLKLSSISQLVMWLAIFLGFVFLMEFIAGSNPEMQSEFVDEVMTTTNYPILFILSIGIAVPVFEEFLFRGFLFVGIEGASNHHIAVWTTALIFALIHIQYSLAIMATIVIMGLILGYSKVLTKSIWTPIFLHMVNNIMTSLVKIWESSPV